MLKPKFLCGTWEKSPGKRKHSKTLAFSRVFLFILMCLMPSLIVLKAACVLLGSVQGLVDLTGVHSWHVGADTRPRRGQWPRWRQPGRWPEGAAALHRCLRDTKSRCSTVPPLMTSSACRSWHCFICCNKECPAVPNHLPPAPDRGHTFGLFCCVQQLFVGN